MSQTKKSITVMQLYPNEMNIYGDRGNVLTLLRRLEWHGYEPKLLYAHPGKPLPKEADLLIGGGGQDAGQAHVQDDLLTKADALHQLAETGTPMLVICGLYQLFGRFFKTSAATIIQGIGILAAETVAGPQRLTGNIVVKTPFAELVGYENHSGQTFLDDPSAALGTVVKGAGNNGQDHTEGAVYKSVYGSYMHGSLLPKNPELADLLIEKAVIRKYGEFEANVIDDRLAILARQVARTRPR